MAEKFIDKFKCKSEIETLFTSIAYVAIGIFAQSDLSVDTAIEAFG
ncbi:MAG: hypothetical protein F6K17_38075 [Okeania sp. SIO3C4]|nr:hypothetical protein [Okeania sp. SIO3B3]NEP77884.1 hypothetical protein [Okeania sp. SIO3B3]NER07951.1 hypothetical protein [Okeania sp. SIO3C4]